MKERETERDWRTSEADCVKQEASKEERQDMKRRDRPVLREGVDMYLVCVSVYECVCEGVSLCMSV